MRSMPLPLVLLWLVTVCGGCIDVNIPEARIFASDPTFVVKGTAESVENNGSCLVWVANDGRIFVLVQSARVPNEYFDAVTTPGTASRIELTLRSDLGPPCRADATLAEVTDVLEIDGMDVPTRIEELGDQAEVLASETRLAVESSVNELKANVAGLVADFEDQVSAAREAAGDDFAEFADDVDVAAAELTGRIEAEIETRRTLISEQITLLASEFREQLLSLIDDLRPEPPSFGRP